MKPLSIEAQDKRAKLDQLINAHGGIMVRVLKGGSFNNQELNLVARFQAGESLSPKEVDIAQKALYGMKGSFC